MKHGLIKSNRNFLDKFFDDDFRIFEKNFFNTPFMDGIKTNQSETEDKYLLEFSLPGMTKDDINIELDNSYLIVSSKKEEGDDTHWTYQSFSKSYHLGESVDMDNIKSSMKDGILSIDLPKTEKEKPKRKVIEIE